MERWWINLGGGRPPGIRVGRRGTALAPSVHAPTVCASPRLIHLSVGLIVQLLLGARTNHVHPLVPATINDEKDEVSNILSDKKDMILAKIFGSQSRI